MMLFTVLSAGAETKSGAAVPAPTPMLSLACGHEQANALLNLGMQDMLLGWDEQALYHFTHAFEEIARSQEAGNADDLSPLVVLGIMLTRGPSREYIDLMQRQLAADVPMTPQEMNLMNTFLCLLRGERQGAGEEFAARADQFRADWLSASWAAILLHDGYDEIGNPLPGQKKALAIADRLYAEHSGQWAACYARALVEETAPQVSDTALEAARKACELLPEHPSTWLLLGHLLYRRGEGQGAIDALGQSVQRAEKARENVPHGTIAAALVYWPLELRARLYLCTVLAQEGRAGESQALIKELVPDSPKDIAQLPDSLGKSLLDWEARTLPLRLLVLRQKLPSQAEVTRAISFSETLMPSASQAATRLYHDCMRYCLAARKSAAEGKKQHALACLKAAEEAAQKLQSRRDELAKAPHALSSFERAQEACRMAVLSVRLLVFKDTADIWRDSLEEAMRPASLRMPPVLIRY